MSLYYAFLSGSHPTLPLAELEALLEALGYSYAVLAVFDQVAVFASDREPRGVAERSGYIHEVGRAVAVVDAEPGAIASTAPLLCRLLDPPFRVSVDRVKGYREGLSERELARELGAAVVRECGASVNLSRPRTVVRVIVSEGVAVVGVLLEEQERRGLNERRPERRPFFRSVALEPRLCRLFTNLARPRQGRVFLDPFCGTGGFALEVAATHGVHGVCSDVDPSMVEGARRNLIHYQAYHLFDVVQADATALPLRGSSVHSIGTDPPYGRQAPVNGRRVEEILEGFLREASRVLALGGHVSFAAPHWVRVGELVERAGLRLREEHVMRVHGGLARIMAVACSC